MNGKNLKISAPKFMISTSRHGSVYCSVCGKKVEQEKKNMKEHKKKCGFTNGDIPYVLRAGKDYGYKIIRLNRDHLLFGVFEPVLSSVSSETVPDIPKKGGWKSIYQALFSTDSTEIREWGRYNLQEWISRIQKGKMRCLNTHPVKEIISSVFPMAVDIYSLSMFCELYRSGVFHRCDVTLPEKIYQEIRKGTTGDIPSFWMEKLKRTGCAGILPDAGEAAGLLREACTEEYIKDGYINLAMIDGKIFYGKKRYFLTLRIYTCDLLTQRWEYTGVAVSRDYLFTTRPLNLYKLSSSAVISLIPDSKIAKFAEIYPHYKLKEYLAGGGKNILIPLLAGTGYHKGVSLLLDAGLGELLDAYFSAGRNGVHGLFYKEPEPMRYATLGGFLGMPVFLLKEIPQKYLILEADRKRWAEIKQYNPALLKNLVINDAVYHFLHENDVTHNGRMMDVIPTVSTLSDSIIRRILGYLSDRSMQEYEMYKEYIRYSLLMKKNGIPDADWTPEDLEEALYEISHCEDLKEAAFTKAILPCRRYTTNDKDDLIFGKEHYVITCPENLAELSALEGEEDFEKWTDRLLSGQQKILFLKREEQDVTAILAVKDRALQKVIPLNVTVLSNECQRFLCKWCEHYGLRIKTEQISIENHIIWKAISLKKKEDAAA